MEGVKWTRNCKMHLCVAEAKGTQPEAAATVRFLLFLNRMVTSVKEGSYSSMKQPGDKVLKTETQGHITGLISGSSSGH